MSLSKLRIVALSSGVRSCRHVVFIIPFRAATISDPFISLGIRLCQGQQQTVDFVKDFECSVWDLDRLPANYFKLTHSQLKVFIEIFNSGSHYLQKIQCYVKVLQSYSTLCAEKSRVMSPLVNSYIMQIISTMISIDFCPRLCSLCPR